MKTDRNIISKVRETIQRYRMIDPGDRLIVAVSGGPDSVCMLDILHQLKDEMRFDLIVAHFDHGFRPAEDSAETQFVRRLAASMNLPFEKGAATGQRGKDASEEWAREARYDFFEGLLQKMQAEKIAVGHNLNDQAETVLMRLMRGSGPSGLAGIPPRRGESVIRPLIEIKREEILAYLKDRQISFVTDPSNSDKTFFRNRIRLELLPALIAHQPRLIEHLGDLADLLRDENAYLDQKASDWVMNHAGDLPDGGLQVPVETFLKLSNALRRRVARHIMAEIAGGLRRIEHRHIQSIHRLALGQKPQAILNLPNHITVKKSYDHLSFFCGEGGRPEDYSYPLGGPGTTFLKQVGKTISLTEIDGDMGHARNNQPGTAYLNGDKIAYPLTVRNYRPGDKFIPLGMKGHKKLKSFFIDLKLPSEKRHSTPILLSRGIPVWVCGLRIDDRFKVTPGTKKILKVTLV
ncbi:tRNA lysidine(34) synthetase TilS [Thermodesulfobacteriota bacterium]